MQRRDSCLIGCGAAGVVLVLSLLALAVVLRSGSGWVRDQMQQHRAWQGLEQEWRPPSATATNGAWWPGAVGRYALASQDAEANLPAWGVEGPGWRGQYRKDRHRIDVHVYRRTSAEREQLFESLTRSVGGFEGQGEGIRKKVQKRVGALLTFHVSPPEVWGAAWGHGDWAFVALSDSEAEVEVFLREYLRSLVATSQPVESTPKP